MRVFIALAIAYFLVFMLVFSGNATCNDGWASSSIGRSGACSHHGGVSKSLFMISFWLALLSSGLTLHVGSRIIQRHNRRKETSEQATPTSSVVPAVREDPPVKTANTKQPTKVVNFQVTEKLSPAASGRVVRKIDLRADPPFKIIAHGDLDSEESLMWSGRDIMVGEREFGKIRQQKSICMTLYFYDVLIRTAP